MNPLIGSSIISGVGSTIGGLFGLSGSNKAAKAQLQAARETNAMNYKIAQENNAFNEKMWNASNEYNTPSAQKKRFEEAGLNPNLMMDGSSAGNAASNVTADTSGVQVAPDIGSTIASGSQQLGNSVSSAANNIAQMNYQNALQKANINKINSETHHQDIENDYAALSMQLDMLQKLYGGRLSKTQWKLLQSQFDDLVSEQKAHTNTAWSQFASTEAGIDKTKVETALLATQQHIAKVHLDWLPVEKQANLRNVLANTSLALAQADASRAQKKMLLAMAALNQLQADGVKIDNRIKARTEDLVVGITDNNYETGLWTNEKSRLGLDIPYTNLPSMITEPSRFVDGGYGTGHPKKYHSK